MFLISVAQSDLVVYLSEQDSNLPLIHPYEDLAIQTLSLTHALKIYHLQFGGILRFVSPHAT